MSSNTSPYYILDVGGIYLIWVERYRKISEALSYETAIEIIDETSILLGIGYLQKSLETLIGQNPEGFVLVPIKNGGTRIGSALSSGIKISPMQMSNYDRENKRLSEPICVAPPNIDDIISAGSTRDVVFAEGVVESEKTILKSIITINQLIEEKRRKDGRFYPFPNYHTFSLISKINGSPKLDKLVFAFWIDERIWVHGWGVDNSQKGRDMNSIWGVLSPFAKSVPQEPYYKKSPGLASYVQK